MEIIALVIASLLLLTGVVGSFAPVLPGAPLIWLGMLLYGLIAGFGSLDVLFFLLQACLALAVIGIDYLAAATGSRYFGASKFAAAGAALGLMIGLFFFPVGLLVGPFLGAVLLELIFSRKADLALRSGLGAVIGFWVGFVFKLALEAVMIAWFFARVL